MIFTYKENGDEQMWHPHKDKGQNTHGICVTFTQGKVGQFHSEKEAKRCRSPHKIGVMYEIKGNDRRFKVNEKELCDSHTKLNWRTCVAVHT